VDMLQENLNPSRQQFIVDKHWYMKDEKVTLSLGFGLIWQGGDMYSGSLAQNHQKWAFVLRPNIRF
jgi:hypothetical protein